jgi:hypothetical protein
MDPPPLALSDDWAAIDPPEHDRISVPGGTVEIQMQLHRDLRVCSSTPARPPWRFIVGATISPPAGLSAPRGLTPVVRRAAVARFRGMLADRGFTSLHPEGTTSIATPDGATPLRRLRARVRIAGTEHPAVAMIAVFAASDGWVTAAGASVLDHPEDPVDPAAVPAVLTRGIASVSR